MIKLVVFGTGTSAERVFCGIREFEGLRVAGVCDNDKRRHGKDFHGHLVVGPEALGALDFDCIVVASIYAPEIRRQLLKMGVAANKILCPNLNSIRTELEGLMAAMGSRSPVLLENGTEIPADELPSVLVLTSETLNSTHGTGVLIQRYFGDFPSSRLLSVYQLEVGLPTWKNNFRFSTDLPLDEQAARLRALMKQIGFVPQVVYATAFNENDLKVLEGVLSALPNGIPVIQHFMDFTPNDENAFLERFEQLQSSSLELWALTSGMASYLEQLLGRTVRHVSALHQRLPTDEYARKDKPCDVIRGVLLGNFWQWPMVHVVSSAWHKCRENIPSLSRINWYAHPERVQQIVDSGVELGDELVWRGFYSGLALHDRLCRADFAILPFNAEEKAMNGYSRFSLPSRITELCSAGLPIFAIASPDTEISKFIESRGCGQAVPGNDPDILAASLMSFLLDVQARDKMATRSRAIAESEFDPGHFQRWFVSRLVDLSNGYVPPGHEAYREEHLVRLSGTDYLVTAHLNEVLCDKIHYACGRNILSGWINVDGFDESFPSGVVPVELGRNVFRLDLTGRHPFPDNFFKYGYSEDFLEHIDQADLIAFLSECFRTFRPGGILRLSTPELDEVLRTYLGSPDWDGSEQVREGAYQRWWHKHFLCFGELDVIARGIGWSNVRRCQYGKSSVPELCQETRPDQANHNLVVELVK
ncbi:MAG: hypothetical protein PHF70_02120 [Opitutales bacterium]|nr:hypothetical protein [Opitutales bacterium]